MGIRARRWRVPYGTQETGTIRTNQVATSCRTQRAYTVRVGSDRGAETSDLDDFDELATLRILLGQVRSLLNNYAKINNYHIDMEMLTATVRAYDQKFPVNPVNPNNPDDVGDFSQLHLEHLDEAQ
jgi:hypothetical protein